MHRWSGVGQRFWLGSGTFGSLPQSQSDVLAHSATTYERAAELLFIRSDDGVSIDSTSSASSRSSGSNSPDNLSTSSNGRGG